MKPLRPTFAEIHLSNLEHNLKVIRDAFPADTFICPMIKANAYGHGDVMIGTALEKWGVKHLGVCLVEEAVLLREVGIQAKILIFKGFHKNEIEPMERYNLIPVVTDMSQLELLRDHKKPFTIHVKFNTGMNRLGFEIAEAPRVAQILEANPFLKLEGVLTHLSDGENSLEEGSVTDQQLQKLTSILPLFEKWNPVIHALNSGGMICRMMAPRGQGDTINFWGRRRNWGLRPGLSLYGYNPTNLELPTKLKPVMSLKSHVQSFRKIKKGAKVSYGGSWQAQRDSTIGLVPIGYADGVSRVLSNQVSFLVDGMPAPQVGRICMDFLLLDLTDLILEGKLPEDKLVNHELEVTLFGYSSNGQFLSAEDLARRSGTIAYEILSRVSERVPRVMKTLSQNNSGSLS